MGVFATENIAKGEIVVVYGGVVVPVSEQQQQKLIVALERRLERSIQLKCELDPSLIGGAIIRAGDLVIDGSVKSTLQRLAVAMIEL